MRRVAQYVLTIALVWVMACLGWVWGQNGSTLGLLVMLGALPVGILGIWWLHFQ